MIEAGTQLRRVNGHQHLPALRAALEAEAAKQHAKQHAQQHAKTVGPAVHDEDSTAA
jgi:hypothetical protein